MRRELKPSTVARKQLAVETLPDFLARMTLVWQARQVRLAARPASHLVAVNKWQSKVRAVDPDRFAARRRAAVALYAVNHPERVAAGQARKRLNLKLTESDSAYEARLLKASQRHAERMQDPVYREKRRLYQVAQRARRRETVAAGAVAKRREGGAAPLVDAAFKATTWRAPWGPGYALSEVGFTP